MIRLVKNAKKPFSLSLYISHRLIRLMPLYVIVIFLAFCGPIAGTGPVWVDTVGPHIKSCYRNWWTNLIFLNNFIDSEHMCLNHSWYIAVDMQLYLLSLVILLPMIKWPKIGLSLAGIFTFGSIASTSLITYFYKFPPTMLFVHADPEQREYYQSRIYYKPYVHAGPYCIGILAGYLIATRPTLRFPRMVQVIGWCAAAISNVSVLYGVWEWNKGRDPELWETMLYSGLHRTAWALGVAWIVICCTTGQGGVANHFLNWKVWIPLSRLTYAAYLIHPIVQITTVGTLRMKLQPFHDFAVWMYGGHMMIIYGAALTLSMLIEAPFLALEKIFMPESTPPNQASRSQPNVNGPALTDGRSRKVVDDKEANLHSGMQNFALQKCNGTQNRALDLRNGVPDSVEICKL